MDPEDQNEASPASEQTTQDANQETADASAAVAQDAKDPVAEEAKVEEQSKEKTLLSVVKDAVKKDPEDGKEAKAGDGEDASSASENGEDGSDDEDADKSKADAEDKDGDDDRFDKHPRFQELRKDRDKARQEAEDLRPRAENFDKIQTFMDQSQLDSTAVAELLGWGALVRNDPERAHAELSKMVSDLGVAIGKQLPEDLQAKVESGELDEQTAADYALTRQKNVALEAKDRETAEATKRSEEGRAAQLKRDIDSEVLTVEAELRQKEPDYPKIDKRVADRLGSNLRALGRPLNSPAEARQMVETAFSEVMEEVKALVPRPENKRPPNPSTTAANRGGPSRPKSTRDAVRAGIAQARR